jgi:CheY-like chemotaxis protein
MVEDKRSLSILLVDDHPEVRETTAALLSELGHEITEASSGAEALTILDTAGKTIDVLLSDYAMPQLSGTDLLVKARQMLPTLPAVLITGYADADEIKERPRDVAILSKPFRPEDLAATLRDAVRRAEDAQDD